MLCIILWYYHVCTAEDDTISVETCRESDEFHLISVTCVVLDCSMKINKVIDQTVHTTQHQNRNHLCNTRFAQHGSGFRRSVG
jgi:hypothetical protein